MDIKNLTGRDARAKVKGYLAHWRTHAKDERQLDHITSLIRWTNKYFDTADNIINTANKYAAEKAANLIDSFNKRETK